MPTAVESPIDFRQLKAALSGADRENPVNCVVARYRDGTVSLAVDKRRPAKVLARGLEAAGSARFFYGTAFHDTYPGTLCLALDRAPASLAVKLRLALRGSGFGKVDISRPDGEAEAESEEY